jgi:hypothetical protein
VATIRGQKGLLILIIAFFSFKRKSEDQLVVCLLISDVPVTDAVYLKETEVTASDFSDTIPVHGDLPFVVVLRLPLHSAGNPSFNLMYTLVSIASLIIMIGEFHFAS